MKLSRYGAKEWGTATAVALVLAAVSLGCANLIATGLVIVAWVLAVAFFRDPARSIPLDQGIMVAPADGVIDDIARIRDTPECDLLGCSEAWRIGIFLSVFNVHINRSPCDLEVLSTTHRNGRHGNAMNVRAELANESQTLTCKASAQSAGLPLVIRQISGAVARRIVCTASEGMRLHRGEQFGMIKYGSRTQLFVPVDPRVHVTAQKRCKVRAGESILIRVTPDRATAEPPCDTGPS